MLCKVALEKVARALTVMKVLLIFVAEILTKSVELIND